MTRNQRRKSRTEQRRRWRYERRLARYVRQVGSSRPDGLVNMHAVMKLVHPDDGTYYDYRTDSFRPMPPYRSPAFFKWLDKRLRF